MYIVTEVLSVFYLDSFLPSSLGILPHFSSSTQSSTAEMALKLVSLNVNCLQSKAKRRSIFKTCREAKYEFSLLQETHSTTDIESTWRAEWGGQILFSHGDSNSRGIAILIRKGSEFVVEQFKMDTNGRYLVVRLVRDQEKFLLATFTRPLKTTQQNK